MDWSKRSRSLCKRWPGFDTAACAELLLEECRDDGRSRIEFARDVAVPESHRQAPKRSACRPSIRFHRTKDLLAPGQA